MSNELPTISIVVPNFNSGATLPATLQSLVDQNYPGLEILVADGGSTDNSVEIIRQFGSKITWWISEKDRGQSDAINKGFARCTGEIVNWLCSDDLLEAGALQTVAEAFIAHPDLDVLAGSALHEYIGGDTPLGKSTPTAEMIQQMPMGNSIPQPACFYRRRLLDRDPTLDISLHYTMDFDLWCHFVTRGAKWAFTEKVLARATVDGQNKMSLGGSKIVVEMEEVYRRYVHDERVPLVRWYARLGYPLDVWRSKHPSKPAKLIAKGLKLAVYLSLAPFYGGLSRVRRVNWSAYV